MSRIIRKFSVRPKMTMILHRSDGLKENFVGYLDNTSIHGLKYLTESSHTPIEKFLWTMWVLLSIGACIYLMSKPWSRWCTTPVIVTMDESQRTVRDIPFPAITICPQAKIHADRFNFSNVLDRMRNYKNVSIEEINTMSDIQLLCDLNFSNATKFKNNSAIDRIEKLSLSLEDIIVAASFNHLAVRFERILTDDGLCYTFNMVPGINLFRNNTFFASKKYLNYRKSMKWCPTNGYENERHVYAYPYRSLSAGKSSGLALLLKTDNKHFASICSLMALGFRVHLHSPIDFPRVNEQSFMVPLDSIVEVSIFPSEVRTSTELRDDYAVKDRQCYFPDERHLRFFKIYTQHNCELECLSNYTLKTCNCVPFYLPRTLDTPICGYSEEIIHCIGNASDGVHMIESGLSNVKSKLSTVKKGMPCNCLQSCTHLQYFSEKSQASLLGNNDATKKLIQHALGISIGKDEHFTFMTIDFKETYFTATRRMEVFGTFDFLANIGGLLGLCLGMSMLSVIECIHWMLLRPFCKRQYDEEKEQLTTLSNTKANEFSKAKTYMP